MIFRKAFETRKDLIDTLMVFSAFFYIVKRYLQTIMPVAFCVLSLLYLSIQIFRTVRLSSKPHKYKPLLQTERNGNGRYGAINGHLHNSDGDDEDTEEEEEEYLTIQRTLTTESVVVDNQPKGELLLVTVEETAVLAELGIHIAVLVYNAWGKSGSTAAIAQISVWAYIAVLTTLRLFFSSVPGLSFSRLWYHTAF